MHSSAKSISVAVVALLLSSVAHAERVTWRASGVVTQVGVNARTLPFTVTVGQPFVIDMTMENDPAVAPIITNTGINVASSNNIFSAVIYVGQNQMTITPSRPWATTFWNDYVIQSTSYDYYSMPIVDATTQWEARWAVQTPVAPGTTGPMTALSLLRTPPRLSEWQSKIMEMTPSSGGYEPAFSASLDSLTVIGPNASNPTVNQQGSGGGGGGGLFDLGMIALLSVGAMMRRLKRAS